MKVTGKMVKGQWLKVKGQGAMVNGTKVSVLPLTITQNDVMTNPNTVMTSPFPVIANPYAVIARSAATKQSLTKDALIVTDCFAALAMTAKGAMTALENAITVLIGHIHASAHFQLSIFN